MNPTRGTYAGLFLTALATLSYELMLTRIFSVTMWYHFAFVAISVAMFGMTVGAIVVYVLPERFPAASVHRQLAIAAAAFALSIPVSLLLHLSVPFVAQRDLVSIFSLAFTYVAISAPFVCSGIVVALVLTRFVDHVSSLYAADLAGAAFGCIVFFCALALTDGPTAVFAIGALAAIAAAIFADAGGRARLRKLSLGMAAALVLFVLGNSVLVTRQATLLPLQWVKGRLDARPLWESWNSYSRIAVSGSPDRPERPFGWGLSPAAPDRPVRQLHLTIDASAATKLTGYEGDLGAIDFLRYDLINLAHHLRPNADVLVVGVGGGRDLLSALAFGQRHVTGVEINGEIVHALRVVFGDFTGHIADHPRVTLVHDEARSYVTRSPDRHDIVQVSFIDTWAATAAGAYTLSENSLYTVEAWDVFLSRLEPHGILSFSRWYTPDSPASMYRLTSLATAALAKRGVADPRGHILIAALPPAAGEGHEDGGVATILVSPDPFSSADLDRLEQVASLLRADVLLSPRHVADPNFERLARPAAEMMKFARGFPLDIEPPTDDRPYFFHLLRVRNIFEPATWNQGRMSRNQQAVYILAVLLGIVVSLTVACVLLPLWLHGAPRPGPGAAPLLGFFVAIGLGFMLIEISQMQRLNIFLGHPTYGLVVALFTMLLASGIGSGLSGRVRRDRHGWLLVALLAVLVVTGLLTPGLLISWRGAATSLRIAAAMAVLTPMALLMGMAFPVGLARAARDHAVSLPWFWGVNGATSVCASVLAMVISLFGGISVAFWTGVAAYFVAALAYRAAGDRFPA